MTVLQILACGPGASIQDGGRLGFRRYGVSTSGAMDRHAMAVANALVGNPADTAAVELAHAGARFQISGGPMLIASFGAGAAITVSGRRIAAVTSVLVGPGEDITIGPARTGVFSYVAVAGGILSQTDLGSRSFHRRAGLGGLPLAAGRQLACGAGAANRRALRYTGTRPPDHGPIRVVPGPQAVMFSDATIGRFLSSAYRVSSQSDRMGLRLIGPGLPATGRHDIVSDGVVPGSIQVPGDSLPIVLMRDCQTTGGYPKIATVISADLDRLAQVPAGQEIRFCQTSLEEARIAARASAAAIAGISNHLQPVPDMNHLLSSQNLIDGVTRGDDP